MFIYMHLKISSYIIKGSTFSSHIFLSPAHIPIFLVYVRLRKIKERERKGKVENRLFIRFGFLTNYFAKWYPSFLGGEGL